jgi:hypothetical protein
MSSWIVAKNRSLKPKSSVTKYHDTSLYTDVFSIYLNYLGAYIYSQKMGETCNLWDHDNIIKNTLKFQPQVKLLREKPDGLFPVKNSEYKPFVNPMKLKDIQKIAAGVISYNNDFNQTVVKYLAVSGIKTVFDFGIQILKDPAGPDINLLKKYASLIREYQTKSKKATLNIYVLSDNYNTVVQFQTYCDASWKITSLCKNPPRDNTEEFVKAMAELQIMSVVPALILDFSRPLDRFIYLMQRNAKLDYFVELNSKEWFLLEYLA